MAAGMLQQARLIHPPFSGITPASPPSHMQRGLRHPLPTACQITRRKASVTAAAARDNSWVQAPPVDIGERPDSFGPQQPMEAQPNLESATAAPKDAPRVSPKTANTKPLRTQALQPKLPRDPVSRAKRAEARSREQVVYKISAIAASLGVTSLAVVAVYYRFAWHMSSGSGDFPWIEAAATLALTIGGAVGMELWAQYAHKALWHDFEPGWALHKSHHVPRVGPFEDNDVFAIINAIPAMGLCAFGFLTPGVFGGLCFGTGLGITLFGISYMFIHDGLVHRRFPVGPIAEVPYLKKVAIAHTLHHSEKYDGVPWGLFLGPAELEAVGGGPELDKMCAAASAIAKNSGDNRL